MKNVDYLAEQAKDKPKVKEKFIADYKPFIVSCAQKAAGHYIDKKNDDEYSIALEAFLEAINRYDNEKGSFLTFAQNVIKYRIYDYYRKNKKYRVNEVFDDISSNKSKVISLSEKKSAEKYTEENKKKDLVWEIKMLTNELKKWDISFNDLSEISPKHKKTKKMCVKIGKHISYNKDILQKFMNKQQLPAKKIKKDLKIPIKKFERFRKYIIAVVIIKNGDYQNISEYIK